MAVRSALISLALLPALAQAQSLNTRAQEIAQQLAPSLVRIHVIEVNSFEGREVRQEGFGSGVIVSPDGYVVTNHHVAGKAVWMSVTLSDKSEVEATLVGTDPLADIAVIKLAKPKNGQPYLPAKWGDSGSIQKGQPVLAFGCPFAFSQSVTAGIVSNAELIMPQMMQSQMDLDGEDVGSIVRWIGHDAKIYPGNSGGPLVDLNGQIVGINEISVGLGGAIPTNLAKWVADQLIKDGEVVRSYIGLAIQPRLTTQTADKGVLISSVDPKSPAAAAGLQAGDTLLSVGPVQLDVRYQEQVPLANLDVSRLPVGQSVKVTFLRGDKQMAADISPVRRKSRFTRDRALAGWGLTVAPLSEDDLRYFHLQIAKGLVITGVLTGGPGQEAQPPLLAGDLLLKVGDKQVQGMDDVKSMVKDDGSENGTPTVVEVMREGERIVSVVNVGKKSAEDTSKELVRPWLPVSSQAVTPALAKALKLPGNSRGVRVTRLYPEAASGALKVGDIFTKVDGIDIEVNQPEDGKVFQDLIRQYKIGDEVTLTGFRDGQPLSVKAKLIPAKKQARELPRQDFEDLGLTLRDTSFEDLKDGRSDVSGVMVAAVVKGGWASLARLNQGALIKQINGESVGSLTAAAKKLVAEKAKGTKILVLFVEQDGQTDFLEIRTGWEQK